MQVRSGVKLFFCFPIRYINSKQIMLDYSYTCSVFRHMPPNLANIMISAGSTISYVCCRVRKIDKFKNVFRTSCLEETFEFANQ